jgi:hypothetical protein
VDRRTFFVATHRRQWWIGVVELPFASSNENLGPEALALRALFFLTPRVGLPARPAGSPRSRCLRLASCSVRLRFGGLLLVPKRDVRFWPLADIG